MAPVLGLGVPVWVRKLITAPDGPDPPRPKTKRLVGLRLLDGAVGVTNEKPEPAIREKDFEAGLRQGQTRHLFGPERNLHHVGLCFLRLLFCRLVREEPRVGGGGIHSGAPNPKFFDTRARTTCSSRRPGTADARNAHGTHHHQIATPTLVLSKKVNPRCINYYAI